MLLSAQIILRELTAMISEPLPDRPSCELNLGRPVFLDRQDCWPVHHVCLCETLPPGLADTPLPDSVLVFVSCSGQDPESPLLPAGIIRIRPEVSLLSLFNKIQILFDRYDAWDAQLCDLLRKESSLPAMLDCCQPVLENPLLLHAADFFMLAHSGIIDENPALSHLIDAAESFETITTSKLDPQYNASREEKEPFFLPAYLSGSRQLCINIFQHGTYAWRLILAEEVREIRPEETALLRHLASYLEPVLLRTEDDSLGKSYSLERTLTEIISGQLTDYSEIDTQLSDYGWASGHRYCCMTLKMTSLDSQNLTSHYLCHHFEEIVPGSCAFQYRDELVVFINLTRFDGTIDKLLLTTTPFLRDSFLKTGVSSSIEGTMDLRYCYQQASIALDSGSKYQNYRWVHRFENISTAYLCDCCVRDMPAHMVCSQKLIRLQAFDDAHNSQFSQTLRVFLDTHLNAVQAAKKLYIHRSTFLYRLERIREIIDIDFQDEETLFYLMLSYRILDLKKSAAENSAVLTEG